MGVGFAPIIVDAPVFAVNSSSQSSHEIVTKDPGFDPIYSGTLIMRWCDVNN